MIKPMLFNTEMVCAILDERKTATRRAIKPQPPRTARVARGRYPWEWFWCEDGERHEIKMPCRPGDILYVRETWGTYSVADGIMPKLYYRADNDAPAKIKWRPAIHMPKAAARIFLLVNDVRVERLQDIDEDGAIAEGCIPRGGSFALDDFEALWDRTVKRADLPLYGWAANPFVRTIEFKRISREEAMK